ncbi:MAG: hypothetical protein ACO3IT_09610, partial [Ilumatobacteraceae bacterium]
SDHSTTKCKYADRVHDFVDTLRNPREGAPGPKKSFLSAFHENESSDDDGVPASYEHATKQMLFSRVYDSDDPPEAEDQPMPKAFHASPELPKPVRFSPGKFCVDCTNFALTICLMAMVYTTTCSYVPLPTPATLVDWLASYCAPPIAGVWAFSYATNRLFTKLGTRFAFMSDSKQMFAGYSLLDTFAFPRIRLHGVGTRAQWFHASKMFAILAICMAFAFRPTNAQLMPAHSVRSLTGDVYINHTTPWYAAFTARPTSDTRFLICDSGCTSTIISDLSYFTKRRQLPKPVEVEGVNGKLNLTMVGDVVINFTDTHGLPCCMRLQNVLYNDTSSHNLLSISDLNNAGWNV